MKNWLKGILSYLGNERGQWSYPRQEKSWLQKVQEWYPQDWQQRYPELAPKKAPSAIPEATAAMQETQRRAAEDRARAIAEARLGYEQAQQALQAQQQQAIAGLAPWQAQIQALQAQPETIGAAEAGQMFEAARTPIEAGTQGLLRGMQEQYSPGGFKQGAMQQAIQSQIGQLGGTAQQIALERTLRRKQDLMNLMGQQSQYGQTLSGIYGRTGAGLADIYGARASALERIYGSTLTAIPTYQGYGTAEYTQPWTYQQG